MKERKFTISFVNIRCRERYDITITVKFEILANLCLANRSIFP